MSILSIHRPLLEAIARYWHGYASTQEAESAYLRSWSDETLSRDMVERALAFIDAQIFFESNLPNLTEEYGRANEIVYTLSHRIWNDIRTNIVGLNSRSTNTIPDNFRDWVKEASKSSLVLCVVPSSYIEPWQDFVNSIRALGRFVLALFPVDIDALARGRLTLFELTEYKLYRQTVLEKPDNECQFSETSYWEFSQGIQKRQSPLFVNLDKAIEAQGDQPTKWAEHPKLDMLLSMLRDSSDCTLIGPSSSGKSILAFQCGVRLKSAGYQIKYIDIGSLSPQLASRSLHHLLDLNKTNGRILLIIDDLQSGPTLARYLLTITKLLRLTSSAKRLVVLAITWPSFAKQILFEFGDCVKIDIFPSDVQRALLSKYQDSAKRINISEISSLAGDDILIWRLILETPILQTSGLSKINIAEELWERKIKNYHGDLNMARRAVLVASLLGRYEFELSEGFLEFQADVSKSSLTAMYKSRLLRKNRNKIVLGHRSLCNLLADLLSEDRDLWKYFHETGKPSQPIDIVQSFIRSVDGAEVWSILRTLRTLVGFKGAVNLSHKAQILADAWQAIDSLVERIEEQQSIDPTWSKTISSALFAIEALCSVGKRDKARPSIEFIRNYWHITDDSFRIMGGTSERYDFDRIIQCMKDEDEAIGITQLNVATADKIDPDRFHQIWLAGIILCSEAAYKDRSLDELQELALVVEKFQEEDGNFYPSRVPWSTARVLMGLTRCGRNYVNSPAVQKACEWLLRSHREGGVYQDGVWESGTGAWNTPIETTSMCLIALTMAGFSSDDPRLQTSWKYLLSQRNEWTKPKRELDGVLALNAHMALAGNWLDVSKEVNFLLRWARGEAFWDSATKTAKEVFDQSLRVAFIAATLVDLVWSSLRTDLPEFLEAFAVPEVMYAKGDEGTEVYDFEKTPEYDINYLLEEVSQRIILEHENIVGRCRTRLDQLKNYADKLSSGQQVPISLLEIKRNQEEQLDKIKSVDSSYQNTISRLRKCKKQDEIERVYEDWKNAIMDK